MDSTYNNNNGHQQAYGSPLSAHSQATSPNAPAYSTLEHDSSLQNGQYPEVSGYSTLPEVNHQGTPASAYAHVPNPATPSTVPEVYKKEGAFADGGAYGPGAAAGTTAAGGAAAGEAGLEVGAPKGDRRICGVKRKIFWILLIAAVVIVIAAVAGGVGGALAAKSNSASSSGSDGSNEVLPPADSDAPLAVYPGTRLASSNFTDQFGNDNYMVIYQVNNGALYMSSWNTSASKWIVSPVADGKTNALKLEEIALGTTISLDTYWDKNSRIMHLYWLDSNGVIKSARHDNLRTDGDAVGLASDWYKAPASDLYTAAPGTNIVSYGRECTDGACPVWSYLVWQRADGSFQSAGLDPGKQWASLGGAGDGVAKATRNTSMAMAIGMAQPSTNNGTQNGTQFRSLSVFYRQESSGSLAQLIWDRRDTQGGWVGGTLPRGLGPNSGIAGFSTGNNDTDTKFLPMGFNVLTTDPDAGKNEVLLTYFKDGSWTSGPAIDIMADCASLATMVANQGRRIYCLAKKKGDDKLVEIREYRWRGDPADSGSYRDYVLESTLSAGAA